MTLISILLQVQSLETTHQAAADFKRMDPYGLGMAIIAMTIVFTVLAIIFLIYKYISRVIVNRLKAKTQLTTINSTPKESKENEMDAEVSAAISLALHLYNSTQHDLDSLTLTIQKVSRMYSPWSSKIYTLRQLPR